MNLDPWHFDSCAKTWHISDVEDMSVMRLFVAAPTVSKQVRLNLTFMSWCSLCVVVGICGSGYLEILLTLGVSGTVSLMLFLARRAR